MVRKKTPKQQLVDLYDEMLKYYLRRFYTTHCTDSKRVQDAAQAAMEGDYKERTRLFREKLDEVIYPLEEEIDQCKMDLEAFSDGLL